MLAVTSVYIPISSSVTPSGGGGGSRFSYLACSSSALYCTAVQKAGRKGHGRATVVCKHQDEKDWVPSAGHVINSSYRVTRLQHAQQATAERLDTYLTATLLQRALLVQKR